MEAVILKQEERIDRLTIEVSKANDAIKKKNELIRKNENYSMNLINIINQLKNELNNNRNLKLRNEKNQLNLKISDLQTRLEKNRKVILNLETKNKNLEDGLHQMNINYAELKKEYNLLKNNNLIQNKNNFKSVDFSNQILTLPNINNNNLDNNSLYYDIKQIIKENKKNENNLFSNNNNIDKLLIKTDESINFEDLNGKKFYNNFNKNILETDEFLLSEDALPKILPTNRNNNNTFSLKNYSHTDLIQSKRNMNQINEMMTEILEEFNK